ncbi:MAG: fumarylacetoacetase [Rhizobium sp.]
MLKRSWVKSANRPETDFPIQNLPYGVFSEWGGQARCGVAIGDFVLDVAALEAAGIIALSGGQPLLQDGRWNPLMAAGPEFWAALREKLVALLEEDAAERSAVEPHLVPLAQADLHMPLAVSEYTDFYAGRHHAFNVGSMYRGPENALPANWLSIPIGYNGRASSVVVSGTPVRRPWGQVKPAGAELPQFAPSARFDFELELGAIVGTSSNGMISVAEADDMIFGFVLLNDWSARDIQTWEYQPLGPFQAKASATTISPWIVTKAALEPFRVSTPPRDRLLLPYLQELRPLNFDIRLEVGLNPPGMSETVICRTNTRELYYSAAQQLAHHASCGCPMSTGDLLGSGTISGPERENRGSLLELTWNGQEPLVLADGQAHGFLEDGDRLTIRGHAQGVGYRIGFGPCSGEVLPPVKLPNWAGG